SPERGGMIGEIAFHGSPKPREIVGIAGPKTPCRCLRRRGWRGKPAAFFKDCFIVQTDAAGPLAPPPPRSRGDLHHARGGGDLRAAGHALFDRQGFLSDASPGAEGVLPRATAVPAAP